MTADGTDLVDAMKDELSSLAVENAALKRALADAEEVVQQWTRAAGWATGHGDTLRDMLSEMRSQHCDERSYADLAASGGLPEASAGAALKAEVERLNLRVLSLYTPLWEFGYDCNDCDAQEIVGAALRARAERDALRGAIEVLVADEIISAGRARELHKMSIEEQRQHWRDLKGFADSALKAELERLRAGHDPDCDVFDFDPAVGSTGKPCNCPGSHALRARLERLETAARQGESTLEFWASIARHRAYPKLREYKIPTMRAAAKLRAALSEPTP